MHEQVAHSSLGDDQSFSQSTIVGALTRGLLLISMSLMLQVTVPLKLAVCGRCQIALKQLNLLSVFYFDWPSSVSFLFLEAKELSVVQAANCTASQFPVWTHPDTARHCALDPSEGSYNHLCVLVDVT